MGGPLCVSFLVIPGFSKILEIAWWGLNSWPHPRPVPSLLGVGWRPLLFRTTYPQVRLWNPCFLTPCGFSSFLTITPIWWCRELRQLYPVLSLLVPCSNGGLKWAPVKAAKICAAYRCRIFYAFSVENSTAVLPGFRAEKRQQGSISCRRLSCH